MAESYELGQEQFGKPVKVNSQRAEEAIGKVFTAATSGKETTEQTRQFHEKTASFALGYFELLGAMDSEVGKGGFEDLYDSGLSDEQRAEKIGDLAQKLRGYVRAFADPELDMTIVSAYLHDGIKAFGGSTSSETYPDPDEFLTECVYQLVGASLIAGDMELAEPVMLELSNQIVFLDGGIRKASNESQAKASEATKKHLLDVYNGVFDGAVDLVGDIQKDEIFADPNAQIDMARMFRNRNLGRNDLDFLKKLYWMTRLSSEKYNQLTDKTKGDRAELRGDLSDSLGGVEGIDKINAEYVRLIGSFESGTERISAGANKLYQKFRKNSEKYLGGMKAKNEAKAKNDGWIEDYDDSQVSAARERIQDDMAGDDEQDVKSEPRQQQKRSFLDRLLRK